MPNQLSKFSKSKRRQSPSEHEAVLVSLTEIVRQGGTTVIALLHRTLQQWVREIATEPDMKMRKLVLTNDPKMPARFKTPAQVALFKRGQRESDQILLGLAFVSPQYIQ